ncbi:bifunctional lytic transglycosylase/C40 family peptidase [Streptomyces pseudovenezuelae]|uniref:bifunctional lytic transglycosylase/C40 family peptidase n=1 Tax=Streptomyces pseudovenezuelae TaxID=67350 RepID=UPI0036E89CEC
MSRSTNSILILATAGVTVMVAGLAAVGGAVSDDNKPAGLAGQLDSTKIPAEYREWVTKAGQTCAEVTAPVIAAQIEAESGWNPNAKSGADAQGLSQFIPGTWRTWGVDADADGTADPYTPADAIMTQARYDCWLAGKVKSYADDDGEVTRLMLAAYNAGPGAVEQYHGIPPYPETQNYVNKIMTLVEKYTAAGTGDAASGPFGQRIAGEAKKWLGTPYSWGGGSVNGPTAGIAQGALTKGFDCSSLVQYAVYHASGGKITLPRVSQAQATEGTAVTRANIQVGDLVAWQLSSGSYDHIGIYVGGGQFVHAPRTGDVVKISSLDEYPYNQRTMTIRRIAER